MQSEYNQWIVALSYFVAVIASYVALDMASRLAASKDTPAARYWLYGGAIAMGTGIWSMHFVGMLAFSLPIPIPYSVPVTLLSLGFAIGASLVALKTINRGTLDFARLLKAGCVMGFGVSLMHYTGMAALEIRPRPVYDPWLFVASVMIAIAASVAAMWISFQLKSQTVLTAFWKKSASALVMGIAIWGMHFTAMAAARFAPNSYCLGAGKGFDQQWMALAVGFCTFLFLATTLVISLIDARMVERRHSLEAESERFFNQSLNLLCSVDGAGRLKRTNPAWQKLLGYSRGQLVAQPFVGFMHRDDATRVEGALAEIGSGATEVSVEGRCRAADGSYRSVLWSTTPLEDAGGFYATGHDITAYKHMECDLRQAQKLESVGRLAAGVAHEINTPVQFVNDSCHFLRDGLTELQALLLQYRASMQAVNAGTHQVSEQLEALQELEVAADLDYLLDNLPTAAERSIDGLARVTTIVRSMKAFAHPDQSEKTYADLNEAIQSTLVIARNEYKYVAEVHTEFGEIPEVCCFIGDLNQAVLNIVVNAAHAIEEVVRDSGQLGHITIRTAQEGEHVAIRISDTGNGIPESVRSNVFDPFFTTKPVGKGTGQGLAIARSVIVDKHQGELRFETLTEGGTTFIIRLPIHPASLSLAEAA